jgi:hypothetical protein
MKIPKETVREAFKGLLLIFRIPDGRLPGQGSMKVNYRKYIYLDILPVNESRAGTL